MSDENDNATGDNSAMQPADAGQPASQTQESSGDSSQQQHQQDAGKPAGYDPVDPRTASPEAVEQRINYLYRQVKDQSRTLGEYRGIAKSQSEKIEELLGGMGQVVDHLTTKSFADAEAQIRQRMQQAHVNGDTPGFLVAQEEMIDIKAKKQLATDRQKQLKPQQQPQIPNARYNSATEMGDQAVQDGEITPEEGRIIGAWQSENDPSGQQLRPWAFNRSGDPNNPSPEYANALLEAAAVFKNPRFANLNINQKLEEVDRRMGVRKSNGSQTVMGGNLTNGAKSRKLTLSPNQERIAIKTKFGGPKAKTDADHIDAYRKQIEKVSATKGARQ